MKCFYLSINFDIESWRKSMDKDQRKRRGELKLSIIVLTCINIQHIDCYCIEHFSDIDIFFIIMWRSLLICKDQFFWKDVSVVSLLHTWPSRNVYILFSVIIVCTWVISNHLVYSHCSPDRLFLIILDLPVYVHQSFFTFLSYSVQLLYYLN